jgi:prolyl-tRNA synthetase
VVCPVGYDKSEAVRDAANHLHQELLAAGVDVVLDDRGERPGAMFADWELIGIPYRVVIGERSLKEDQVEFQGRREGAAQLIPLKSITQTITTAINTAKNNLI